jgi:hypothetical protein
MRRFAALIAIPVLAVAGCSDSGDQTSATGPTPRAGAAASTPVPVDPSVAASADKALSGNTKAICDQAARTSNSFGQTFIADLQAQIDAASQGAQAKARAQEKIDQDVSSYSSALAGMGKLADDKKLKTALTQMSKQVKALKGDITKINPSKMSTITATLDSACGKS